MLSIESELMNTPVVYDYNKKVQQFDLTSYMTGVHTHSFSHFNKWMSSTRCYWLQFRNEKQQGDNNRGCIALYYLSKRFVVIESMQYTGTQKRLRQLAVVIMYSEHTVCLSRLIQFPFFPIFLFGEQERCWTYCWKNKHWQEKSKNWM